MGQSIEGPFRILKTVEGKDVPWYILPFDKDGNCQGPKTRAHLLRTLETGDYTHVFLFSHGWNNDWKVASERYVEFADGYAKMRRDQNVAMPAGYRPLLLGVFWPSTSLVLPWERAPKFAGGGSELAEGPSEFEADWFRSIEEHAADLPEAARARFYELVNSAALNLDEVRELAALLLPSLRADQEVGDAGADAQELADAWWASARLLQACVERPDADDDDFGIAGSAVQGGPIPAGLLNSLDPRHALRMGTVWKMKDRAGTVGARGVHPLLADILGSCHASLHLIGHSYGAKVVLSAVSAGPVARPVTSALLLQPAISHLCFALDADGEGHEGGYRVALERVTQPILSTYSRHDIPLTKIFHLAVRRRDDLGEQRIAAGPPSRFAALGGFGPRGLAAGEAAVVNIHDAGQPYAELDGSPAEVVAVNGDRTIGGHGDISNPSTWWMLVEQARRAGF